jgi:hypothetical protein
MQARVKQESIKLGGRSPDVVWAAMELVQFELGVIEPKFSTSQVQTLHATSGPSFAGDRGDRRAVGDERGGAQEGAGRVSRIRRVTSGSSSRSATG